MEKTSKYRVMLEDEMGEEGEPAKIVHSYLVCIFPNHICLQIPNLRMYHSLKKEKHAYSCSCTAVTALLS